MTSKTESKAGNVAPQHPHSASLTAGALKAKRERFSTGEFVYKLFHRGDLLPMGEAIKTVSGLWCAREFSWVGTNSCFSNTLQGSIVGLTDLVRGGQ